jgi:hypothetical protein
MPDENDCFKRKDSTITQDVPTQLASWAYSNPVYIEPSANEDDRNRDEDSIYSYTVQSQSLPAPPKTPAVKQLVRIVEVTDNTEHVSIIITIGQ